MHPRQEGNREGKGKKSDERFIEIKKECVGISIAADLNFVCDEPIVKPWKEVPHEGNGDKESDENRDQAGHASELCREGVVGSAQESEGNKNFIVDQFSKDPENRANRNERAPKPRRAVDPKANKRKNKGEKCK